MKGDRFERLEVLRQEAADRLRLPIEHDKVQLLAALRLNHETLVEKLVAGNSVSPDQLLALSEAIDKLSPDLPPRKIEIELVEGPIEKCPSCGWCRNDGAPPKQEPNDVTPKALPPPAVEAKSEELLAERPHIGSIHDQPSMPLKRYDEPWRV
jgi:hypothetical protein